jgi:MYXO-CTERM domain-containing protein
MSISRRFGASFLAGLLCAHAVSAATVTTNEAALDEIFGQAGFTSPIDIRFLDVIEIEAPRFLNVNQTLSGPDVTDPDGSTRPPNEMDFLLTGAISVLSQVDRIYMIFVDAISLCGATRNVAIVGCALVGENRQVIESGFAAGSKGAELQAHEMVHNLGVQPHTPDGTGLMGATLNGQTDLDAGEIALIEASSLILREASTLLPYLQVQPVRIYDAALETVPLPPAGLALFGAVGFLALRRRRKAA